MVVYSGIEHAPPCVECSFIEKPPWLYLEADGFVSPSPTGRGSEPPSTQELGGQSSPHRGMSPDFQTFTSPLSLSKSRCTCMKRL